MKLRQSAATVSISAILLLSSAGMAAAAEEGPPEDPLVIEVPPVEAEPGDIIDIPIMITNNPGVSVIKDLRIDLGRGLTLYFPRGERAYANDGTADTWPYVPEKEAHGQSTGMLPVMGRPTAANIGERHIVLNFLDVTRPFDSTETGTLITIKVQVGDEAPEDIPIRVSGGMYGNMARDGDKEPVLVNGNVASEIDANDVPATDAQEQTDQSAAIAGQVPREVIIAALETDAPYIRLTTDMGTLVEPEMVQQIIESGKPVTIEFQDGTVVVLDPADIPATGEAFDLMDLHPASNPDMQERGSGIPNVVIAILIISGVLLAAVIAVVRDRHPKDGLNTGRDR